MDPRNNPFAPGAGVTPPELAGREDLLESADIALARCQRGRHAKGQLLWGLRGVGKTVLLNQIAAMAEAQGFRVIYQEAPERRSLAEIIVPGLRKHLFSLSRIDRAKDQAIRGLQMLRAFATAFKVSAGDLEFGVAPMAGTADSGNLEADLQELLRAVAEAAKAADQAVALLLDEVHYLKRDDLAALIVALHRLSQRRLLLIFFGAGLPQLAALAGEAKSYAERLFDYPEVGALSASAARAAIRQPIEREGAEISNDALQALITETEGYPYFLQEWGAHTWDAAESSPITAADVAEGSRRAIAQLAKGFFRVRLDRLTPRERAYVIAMAELGKGPHRSGDIAQQLQMKVQSAAPFAEWFDQEGNDLQPSARRHGVYGALV